MFSFFKRRRPQLRLISKEVCPLCDEALELLESLQNTVPHDLTVEKIDHSKELHEQFWDQVPVLFIDGRKQFFGKISKVSLTRALRIAAKRQP